MQDVLHILDVLRERAEAVLVVLTTQRAGYLAEILEIKFRLGQSPENKEIGGSNITDLCVFETWQCAQISHITAIEKEIAELDVKITKAKKHFKATLAKQLSAQGIAGKAAKLAQAQRESKEDDAQMEAFRHSKNAHSWHSKT